MDNKILLEHLRKIPEIKLNEISSGLINAECITRISSSRRKNVVGNINPNGSSFILYNNGEWLPWKKLELNTIDEIIAYVKNDIKKLSI
jgi:hypothetical protein